MKTAIRKTQLLDQRLALSAYFDDMLQDELKQQVEKPANVQVAAPTPAEKPPVVEPSGKKDTPRVAGVPGWDTTTPFQALLFKVAGLTLAVPLIKLKGVMPNEAAAKRAARSAPPARTPEDRSPTR